MGFARQLTPDEIFEQVAKFSAELKKENKRLSNVVMMGMGEPLAKFDLFLIMALYPNVTARSYLQVSHLQITEM